MLKREDITRERIDFLIKEASKLGPFDALSHEEREDNRRQFLKDRKTDDGVWVFGYGSLIWNPAFNFSETVKARLFGFRRRFCLHLTIGRGSPEYPGLMLALDKGGSCNGIAFKIEAKDVESETEILWMREMISGAYQPHWTKMRTEIGLLEGFTFVVNRKHPRYLGNASDEETVKLLQNGSGYLGTCKDYLANTVSDLVELGFRDKYLERLNIKVNQK